MTTGVVVQVEHEMMWVAQSNADTRTSMVVRGYQGTTPAAHADGAWLEVSPQWPWQTVYDSVCDEVADLWPMLFTLRTETLTIDEALYPLERTDLGWVVNAVDAEGYHTNAWFNTFGDEGSGSLVLPYFSGTNDYTVTFSARIPRPDLAHRQPHRPRAAPRVGAHRRAGRRRLPGGLLGPRPGQPRVDHRDHRDRDHPGGHLRRAVGAHVAGARLPHGAGPRRPVGQPGHGNPGQPGHLSGLASHHHRPSQPGRRRLRVAPGQPALPPGGGAGARARDTIAEQQSERLQTEENPEDFQDPFAAVFSRHRLLRRVGSALRPPPRRRPLRPHPLLGQ